MTRFNIELHLNTHYNIQQVIGDLSSPSLRASTYISQYSTIFNHRKNRTLNLLQKINLVFSNDPYISMISQQRHGTYTSELTYYHQSLSTQKELSIKKPLLHMYAVHILNTLLTLYLYTHFIPTLKITVVIF